MGVYIDLIINTNGLTPQKWAKVYKESCRLLTRFPFPLACIRGEIKHGEEVDIFTKNLIQAKGTPDERWEVSGDLLSYRFAEQLSLPKNLSKLPKRIRAKKSVLWASEADITDRESNGYNIFSFDNKTQGYPYHLAILAAATLIENRLPHHAYVHGDITVPQAEKAIAWANTQLKQPIQKPIALDGARLYKHLNALYKKPTNVIARFETLSLIPRKAQFEILFQYEKKATLTAYFVKQLARYTNIYQRGAVSWIEDFLDATGDLKLLIQVLLQVKGKFTLTLADLLKIVLSRHITTPIAQRGLFKLFDTPTDRIVPAQELTLRLMASATYMLPAVIDLYMKREELLDIFASFEPKNRAAFEKIMTKGEKTCKKEVQRLKKLDLQLDKTAVSAQGRNTLNKKIAAASPEAQELLKEAYRQRETIADANVAESIPEVYKVIINPLIKKYPTIFGKRKPRYFIGCICKAVASEGIILTEELWEAIEKEKNIDTLKSVLALLVTQVDHADFPLLRLHILMHFLL